MNKYLWILSMFVVALLAGCQAMARPIDSEYVLAGPPMVEEATEIDGECLLHLVFPWQIEGNLQGTAVTDYKILLHGPCGTEGGPGAVDESWIYTGSFEGELDGRTGTFDYFSVAEINDRILTGQLAIVPGSGGGELTGIAGVISYDASVDEEATPLTGYYYFDNILPPKPSADEEGEMSVMPALDAETVAALESLIETSMAELGTPGVAVGIVLDGELVYAKGFGVSEVGSDQPVTPQSVFQLSSIAKTATSTAIMQLAEEGEIDLDAPVTDYLPYFQLADGRGAEFTIRQLLMHTSGLPDNEWTDVEIFVNPRYDDDALEDHVRAMQDASLLYDPGTQFEYSGMGYDVLGDIIAKVSGQPYETYVAEHVFAPLGMQHTTLLVSEVDPPSLAKPHVPNEDGQITVNDFIPYTRYMGPDSMLYSNVEDMAKYAIAHMNRGASGQPAVLSPESYDAVWTYHAEAPFPPPEEHYGYGWQLGEHQGTQIVGHSGIDIGYNSIFQMIPEQSAALIVLTNYDDLEEWVMPAFRLRIPLLDLLIDAADQE